MLFIYPDFLDLTGTTYFALSNLSNKYSADSITSFPIPSPPIIAILYIISLKTIYSYIYNIDVILFNCNFDDKTIYHWEQVIKEVCPYLNERIQNTVYALGRVNLILLNQLGDVRVVNDNATDYDWNTGGGVVRNALIQMERKLNNLNDTHGFKTFYYGKGKVNK